MISYSKIAARSLRFRTALMLCGFLFLTPPAISAARADVNSVIDSVLNNAIFQTQDMMGSMSKGCSSGGSGDAPQNWDELRKTGDSVVNQLGDLRLALAKGQTANADQRITSIESGLDTILNR